MPARAHPRWLTRRMLIAMQRGPVGGRHDAIVRSALDAPRRLLEREPATDLAALAAAYAVGFANTHGFLKGSKRAAFLAAYVFLGLNDYEIDAAEPEVVAVIERAAAREMTKRELAGWLRGRCVFRR